ncbi:Protein SOMI-1 a, partial [Aphelenchoides avenae]
MTGPSAASGAPEVVKYEPDSQDFAVLSTVPPPHNFQYAPVTNGYSVEQPIYASGQFYQAEPPASEVPYFNGSTSELFSSTYAVLSSDPLASASGNWSPYGVDEKPAVLAQPVYLTSYAPPVPHLPNNGGYITYDHATPYAVPLGAERSGHTVDYVANPPPGNVLVPISVETGAPQLMPPYDVRRSDSSTPQNGADGSGSVDLQRSTISRNSIGSDTDKRKPKMSVRASQAAFSEAFKKVAAGGSVTGSDDNSPAESEDGESGERVQCLACKGVYASRRSLTGHIGRNERCREIIGRNYLDQLVQAGQEECIPDSITTGVSPVCPYCDRFISHYKGNIRRHMNQCNKARSAKGAN